MLLKDRIALAMAQPSRDGKKKTQAGLARACGIKPPSVSGWFSGDTVSIDGKNLTNAAAYLECSAHWLGTGEGSMHSDEMLKEKDQFSDMPERLKTVLVTVAGIFKMIPEDQWGNAVVDVAELLQKGRRFR